MASLIHALLTEDENVLLEALDPTPEDRVLAIFARGNGDAGLALLQRGPAVVYMFDLFDQDSLAAQLQLKQWLLRNLDNSSLRNFLGIVDGPAPLRRDLIFADALRELPPSCRAFWRRRRSSVLKGMAQADSTAAWCRNLDRFLNLYRRLPSALRFATLRAGRCLAPFYFPREERHYSLGYRQLMAEPEMMLERFISRVPSNGVLQLIPYADFTYLSPQGHAAIRQYLDRVQILDRLPAPSGYNKIYLSNVIDYLPPDRFHALLSEISVAARRPSQFFLNSSFASPEVHPHLRRGILEGRFFVDIERTRRARAMDRVGAYPGLTVIASSTKPPRGARGPTSDLHP